MNRAITEASGSLRRAKKDQKRQISSVLEPRSSYSPTSVERRSTGLLKLRDLRGAPSAAASSPLCRRCCSLPGGGRPSPGRYKVCGSCLTLLDEASWDLRRPPGIRGGSFSLDSGKRTCTEGRPPGEPTMADPEIPHVKKSAAPFLGAVSFKKTAWGAQSATQVELPGSNPEIRC